MHPLSLPSDKPPLEFRDEQLSQSGLYTYDLLIPQWHCPKCHGAIVGADPIGIPLVTYRSVECLEDNLRSAGASAYANAELPVCSRCRADAALIFLEHHVYLASEERDVVIRWSPNARHPLSLWFWSRSHGYIPVIALNEEQRTEFTREALLRAIAGHRDFGEHEEAFAVIEEALATIGGDPELLRFLPWLNSLGKYSLSGPIAETYIQAYPDDPKGHFWLGQIYLELVASRTLGNDSLPSAIDAFERAIAQSPNHDYPDADLGLANVERAQGNDLIALQQIDALLSRHPEHAEALYTKGLLLLETDPKGAIWCFERGAELRPDDPDYPRGLERAKAALAAR